MLNYNRNLGMIALWLRLESSTNPPAATRVCDSIH